MKEAQRAMTPWIGGQPVYGPASSQMNPLLYSGTHTLHIRVVFTAPGRWRCPKPASPPPSSWVLTDQLCDWLVKKATRDINSTCLKSWEIANQRRTTKVECSEERQWATTCCWCSLFIGNNWKNNAGAQKNKKAPGGHGFLHTLWLQRLQIAAECSFKFKCGFPEFILWTLLSLQDLFQARASLWSPCPSPLLSLQLTACLLPVSMATTPLPAPITCLITWRTRWGGWTWPVLCCRYVTIDVLKSFQFKCKLFLQSFLFNSL